MTPEIAPPGAQTKGFFAALISGPDGMPDEAALSFLAAQALLFCGIIYNTFIDRHFPLDGLVGGETGLLSIYNASVGLRTRLGG